MSDGRPDPQEILRRVQAEERRAHHGKLTIFFGAAPGVGKTYAMLQQAGRDRAQGVDVVVGVVETHGRRETQALLEGLEPLPRRAIEYRGVTLHEFDLDAALARKPGLILVDELAHTNAEGSRHPKRWQDVTELLDAGIDVYTTLNVQHLESLSEVIAVGMGLVVRETVPDSVLELADEVRLIDLPPDELLERLAEGRIYIPEQVERAQDNFFRKENLNALRELALRQTAERVGAHAKQYQANQGLKRTWSVSERLLVCLAEGQGEDKVLWGASRMVMRLHVPWVVLHVETPGNVRLREEQQQELASNLRQAEQLGAEVVTVSGTSVPDEILRFAAEWGATRILLGQPRRLWPPRLGGTLVDALLARTAEQDVWVVRTTRGLAPRARVPLPGMPRHGTPAEYAAAALATAVVTAVSWLVFGHGHPADVAMLYLLAVMLVSMRFGYGPSLLAAVLGVLAYDVFFIPPYLSFAFSDLGHVVTFGVLFMVALVISNLTDRIRAQVEASRARERRTAVQYAFSRDLARTMGRHEVVAAAVRHIEGVFECRALVILPDEAGVFQVAAETESGAPGAPPEPGVVQWVWQNGREAGVTTNTLPGSSGLYLPLSGVEGPLGVLGVLPRDRRRFVDLEQRRLLDSFASLTALALERARLAEEGQRTREELSREGLRNTLLASVSHDLRTPIAAIMGAASAMLDESGSMGAPERRELARTVYEESRRLGRRVRDLLHMTRLEAGGVKLQLEWHSLEEIIGAALNRVDELLADRPVRVALASDPTLVRLDGILIGELLVNLLENAIKYSPPASPIEVSTVREGDEVVLEVADRGPGIPPAEALRIFNKFYRGAPAGAPEGVGLGLAICRAIAEAHGGRIWEENRPAGGAAFRVALPIGGEAPPMELSAAERVEGS